MINPGDSRTADIVVAVALLTTLSTLSFVGRVWGRLLSAVRLGWDDLFMTIALLGCWAISADNIVAIRYGSGRHAMYLSSSDIRDWKKAFYAFLILQIVTTTFIKMAILVLYRRTFITKSFRRAVYAVGAIILADSVAIFLAECFYCLPIERLWNPEVPGKCVNPVYFTTIGSSTLLVTDLMVNIMPLPVIWKLHTTMRRKIELTFIFMLGGFACLSRIVQIVDSSRLEVNDLTWSNVDVAVWNMVEVHIGCVAANIPLMGPLFSRLSRRLNLSDHMPSSWPEGTKEEQPSARHTLKGPIGVEHGFRRMKEYGSEVKNSQTQGVVASTIGTGDRYADDAFEMDNLGGHGIMVKTDLEQDYVEPVAH